VVRGGERAVLFLRATFDDFRSSNVINELSKSYDVVQVAWPTKSDMVRLFFKKEYFFCCPGFQNNFKKVSISTSSDLIDKVAVDYLNEQVGVRISTQKHFNWCLGNKKFAYLIGMDDCNYAYPIIYACREKLIPTIGIQHTFYCKEHEAYVMSGLSAHPWFDYLLVYGEFWKEKFLQHNKLFDSDNIYIYQNKSQYGSQKNLTREKKNEPPAVLLIYEFLADTIQIGLYVRKLMNLGYKIYFKVRSDEDILEQIKAYNLPINLTSKWIIVQEINEAIMSVVDYVGGTYSTMLFDLYPYGKPIIVFNTEFIFNSDSLQYISRVCNFEDLDNLETLIITESADVVAEKTKQLFGKTPIVEVLNQIDGLR
jgi:hypothetical protein